MNAGTYFFTLGCVLLIVEASNMRVRNLVPLFGSLASVKLSFSMACIAMISLAPCVQPTPYRRHERHTADIGTPPTTQVNPPRIMLLTLPSGGDHAQYEEDLAAWHEGRRPTKPKFRLFWFEPTSLGYWGGVSYTTGALLYNIGAVLVTFLSLAQLCGAACPWHVPHRGLEHMRMPPQAVPQPSPMHSRA